jgi:predicted enzyme related to lactoylglutathione lyase
MEQRQKNPIGWIEVPVSDMDRAEKFYLDYFGLQAQRQPEKKGYTMSWFDMDMEGYGSAATLMHGEGYTPSHEGPRVYFTAPEGSVIKGLEKAEKMGIKVLMPRMDIGEHGFIAEIEDSEGNRIAIHSMVE